MRPESTLLIAALIVTVAFAEVVFAVEEQQAEAAKAEKSGAKKATGGGGHMEEKATTPKVMQLRDWEELFGHKHMEEETNMPVPEPVSGAGKQETMQPAQEHDQTQEKY